jgi:hypothetical protein
MRALAIIFAIFSGLATIGLVSQAVASFSGYASALPTIGDLADSLNGVLFADLAYGLKMERAALYGQLWVAYAVGAIFALISTIAFARAASRMGKK